MYKILLGLGLIHLTFNHPLLVGLAFVGIYLFENTTKEEKETITKIIMSIYSNGKEFSSYLVAKAAELGISMPELRKKIVIDLEIPEVEVEEETADSYETDTESDEQKQFIAECNAYATYQSEVDGFEMMVDEAYAQLTEVQLQLAKAEERAFRAECDAYVTDIEEEEIKRLQQQIADLEAKAQENQAYIESLTKTTPGDNTWVKETIAACSTDLSDEEKAILEDHEFIGDHIKKTITDLAITPGNTWIHGTLNDCFPIEDDERKLAPTGYRESFIKWGLSIDNWSKVFTPKAYRRLKAQLKAIGRSSDGSILDVEEHNHAMTLLSSIENHFAQENFIEAMSRNQYNPNLVPEGVL